MEVSVVNRQRAGRKFRLQSTGGAVSQRGAVPGDLVGKGRTRWTVTAEGVLRRTFSISSHKVLVCYVHISLALSTQTQAVLKPNVFWPPVTKNPCPT